MQAHVLTDEEFRDAIELTSEAQEKMHEFSDEVNPVRFERPEVNKQREAESEDSDDRRYFDLNPNRTDTQYDPYKNSGRSQRRNDTRNERQSSPRRDRNAPASQVPSSYDGREPAARPEDTDINDQRQRGGIDYRDPPADETPENQTKGGTGWFDLK